MQQPKVLLVFFFTFIFLNATATEYYWGTSGDGDWTDGSRWVDKDGNVLNDFPQSSQDTIIFDCGGGFTISSVPDNLSADSLAVNVNAGESTHVSFEFQSAGGTLNITKLFIGINCVLAHYQSHTINATNFHLIQGQLHIPSANLYLFNQTQISEESNIINAGSIYNSGKLFLNTGELTLQAMFNHANATSTLNFGSGTLIIDYGIDFSIGIYNGSGDCTLKFNSNADEVFINQIPENLQLGTLINESGFTLEMGGDLIIQQLLDLRNGNLSIGDDNILTLRGDAVYGIGAIEGSSLATLAIENDTGSPETMLLKLDANFNTLHTLLLSRPEKTVQLGNDIEITQGLDLSGGKILVKDKILTLGNLTTLIYDVSSYIITKDLGQVRTVSQQMIPVGTENYYAGVEIIQGASNDFYVKVFDGVLSEGKQGYPINTDEIVNLSWEVNSSDDAVNYDLRFEWDKAAEGTSFVLTDAQIMHYNGVEWIIQSTLNDPGNVAGDINFHSLNLTGNYGVYAVTSQMNEAPIVYDQEFTIFEQDPAVGTLVGVIEFSDPNPGQTVYFEPHDNQYLDAFTGDDAGAIYIANPDILDYDQSPVITVTLDACDDGLPILCTTFDLTINLGFYVSNYISPNGDNKNDNWIILGLEDIQNEVFVFNSSGNLVYKAENYLNDWNGTYEGAHLPPGVYFYMIRTSFGNQKGTITLVR